MRNRLHRPRSSRAPDRPAAGGILSFGCTALEAGPEAWSLTGSCGRHDKLAKDAPVAQRIEHRSSEPRVGGLNPSGRAIHAPCPASNGRLGQPRFGLCAMSACFADRRGAAPPLTARLPLMRKCWRPGRMCRSWARCLSRSATDARASSSVVPGGNSNTSDLSKGFLKRSGWASTIAGCDGSDVAGPAAGGGDAATSLWVSGGGLGFAAVVSRMVLNDAMATTITNPPAMPASAPRARLAELCVLVVWLGMLDKIESVSGGGGGDCATAAARCCSSAARANKRMSAGVSTISMVSSSGSASRSAVPPGGILIIASR